MNCRRGNCDARSSARIWNSRVVGPGRTPSRKEKVLTAKSSFDVPALQRRPLGNQVVTRRRIETSNLFSVTIHTCEAAILINRHQLFTQILPQPIFVMTLCARGDRHIGFQASQRCGFCDVDMARRALRNVLLLLTTTIVHELRRDPRRLSEHVRCARELVTAVAVGGDWFLRFPVTVKTRSVICRRGFERRGSRSVTDRAVVITLRRVRETQEGDRVLVLVVRKLDREL